MAPLVLVIYGGRYFHLQKITRFFGGGWKRELVRNLI